MAIVYAIKNKINGKMYIGSSRQYGDNRWKRHRKELRVGIHYSEHLQRAWNKYGETNFEYIILEQVGVGQDQWEREQYWLDLYQVYEPEKGYNSTRTAGLVEMTEDVKQKISAAMKGRPLRPEHIAAAAAGRRGGHLKESTCKKISEARMGMTLSNEHRKKISVGGRGLKRSEATKQKMAAAKIGTKRSEATKQKTAATRLRNKMAQENKM